MNYVIKLTDPVTARPHLFTLPTTVRCTYHSLHHAQQYGLYGEVHTIGEKHEEKYMDINTEETFT